MAINVSDMWTSTLLGASKRVIAGSGQRRRTRLESLIDHQEYRNGVSSQLVPTPELRSLIVHYNDA